MAEGTATRKLRMEKTMPGVNGLAADKHVMAPDQEAEHRNGQAGEGDEMVAEDLLAGESR